MPLWFQGLGDDFAHHCVSINMQSEPSLCTGEVGESPFHKGLLLYLVVLCNEVATQFLVKVFIIISVICLMPLLCVCSVRVGNETQIQVSQCLET